MDASLFYEGTLPIGHEVIHERAKPTRKHLGDDLCNSVNKANRMKVGDLLRPILLGQKCNVCGVKPMKVLRMNITKEINDTHKILCPNMT
jgi:hypothetical protein